MQQDFYNIKCINCDKVDKNNKNIIAYSCGIYYYECSNCIGIEHFVRNFEYSKDKNKFINEMSVKDYEILGKLENANSITESIIIKIEGYQLKKYDLYKITNCTHCKIAMKTVYILFVNNYINQILLCDECIKIKKNILISKKRALNEYFLKYDDIQNLKKYAYHKYYIEDILKKRNEKYSLDIINKKREKKEKQNILKREKKKNKKDIIEMRKKEIIKEGKLFNLDIKDDDFENYNIKNYLYKGDKSIYKLNNIIEMLIEEKFLETKTNYFAYFFTLNYYYNKFSEYILNIITMTFRYDEIKYKYNNEICNNNIILNEKSYIKTEDFYCFYFSYIIKTFSKIEQKNIMKKLYINYSNKIKNNYNKHFARLKTISESYAIKELNKDNKFELPTRFANINDAIINNNCTIKIDKLPDDCYNKYYIYVLKYKPTFEKKIAVIRNKYKEKEMPIEINLVKKNKEKVQKYYDDLFVYF